MPDQRVVHFRGPDEYAVRDLFGQEMPGNAALLTEASLLIESDPAQRKSLLIVAYLSIVAHLRRLACR